jgi:uroporphyrin-III C-methyltransferase/precorrin-2 dehydrogenase/sirohydrochlorin ferrochelatase
MRHFPLFRDLRGRRVVVSGGGEAAVAKLRLLLKTEATVIVYDADPHPRIIRWADEGRLIHIARRIEHGDAVCAALVYGANEDDAQDAHAASIGHAAGALVNIVDDLDHSDFITPAIVDRDPVTVAIGTEGAAPVLARRIKAENEERLPPTLGILARIGQGFRGAANALPHGRIRRRFWSRYYDEIGPRALAEGGEEAVLDALDALVADMQAESPERGNVALIGAGPGDPELLTLKARNALHEADVVIHDRLVSPEILELARREAIVVEVGKIPDGASWKQDDINALMVDHAGKGAHVARLKSGDPAVFGRLDEEMDALDEAGVPFTIIPGITAASAAAAAIGVSWTRRGRNASFRLLTGHDVAGFAEHDWRALARPGEAAAIYMGVRAARFLSGRMLMHGASADTPVTAIENVSRGDQKIVSTTLDRLADALPQAGITGHAILFIGLSPRQALAASEDMPAPLPATGGQ